MAPYNKYLIGSALIVALVLAARPAVFGGPGIINTPHNLSISGGKGAHSIAYNEIRVCVFCHTPHNAVNNNSSAPLWNRALPSDGQIYTMYGSDSFNQKVFPRPSVPTGASRVCLSCHDGTLALNVYGGPVLSGGGAGSSYATMPSDPNRSKNANLTTDLSDDHPISFPYTDDLALNASLVRPESLPANVKLDKNSDLQCTACHDPHENQYGNFLVMNNGDPNKPDYNSSVTSPLCVACHTPSGWNNTSPHYAGAGCLNCHVTHTSPVKQYLLSAPVDQLCFNGEGCHGSTNSPTHTSKTVSSQISHAMTAKKVLPAAKEGESIASSNMQTLFGQSVYKHPIGSSMGKRRANEQLPLKQPRVECVDCHNAHIAGSSSPKAGAMKKTALKGVKGIGQSSMGTVDATNEYEICYKCHSGPYAWKFVGLTKPNRVIAEPDQRKRFDGANPSFHPVAALSKTSSRSSLLAQYQNTMLTIECSDCHNSDQSKKAGGTGPNGPHGSRYEHILIARYDMPLKDTLARNNGCTSYRSDYALCFTCHSEDYVMTTGSAFAVTRDKNGTLPVPINEHSRHVVDRCIPCFACHDPHGVPAQRGATVSNNAHLINFDRGYATSATFSIPRYTSMGTGSGSCAVACHTSDRNSHSYPDNPSPTARRVTRGVR